MGSNGPGYSRDQASTFTSACSLARHMRTETLRTIECMYRHASDSLSPVRCALWAAVRQVLSERGERLPEPTSHA